MTKLDALCYLIIRHRMLGNAVINGRSPDFRLDQITRLVNQCFGIYGFTKVSDALTGRTELQAW